MDDFSFDIYDVLAWQSQFSAVRLLRYLLKFQFFSIIVFFTDEAEMVRENFLTLNIFYGKMHYTEITEDVAYDGFDLLGKYFFMYISTSELPLWPLSL